MITKQDVAELIQLYLGDTTISWKFPDGSKVDTQSKHNTPIGIGFHYQTDWIFDAAGKDVPEGMPGEVVAEKVSVFGSWIDITVKYPTTETE